MQMKKNAYWVDPAVLPVVGGGVQQRSLEDPAHHVRTHRQHGKAGHQQRRCQDVWLQFVSAPASRITVYALNYTFHWNTHAKLIVLVKTISSLIHSKIPKLLLDFHSQIFADFSSYIIIEGR